ncbi:MAG: hypothetical protein ABI572_08605 [Actinomycetota bacterium]
MTEHVPAAGPTALAVAVYADPEDHLVDAKESGFEGVACVDDTARLLDLMCDVWARTREPWAERWARGLLEFVLWMQEPDGRWINFVFDWDGGRNTAGITSETGENFWHARALAGASHAWLTFGEERAHDAVMRGLDHAVTKSAPPDVRVIHMEVARRLVAGAGKRTLLPALRHWAAEVVATRDGDVLMNSADERGTPHLWAHLQEGVLAEAGALLDDPSLVAIAAASADALWSPIVAGGFDRPSVTPYDVACGIYCLDRLARATGDEHWAALAADARAWFDGRNPAGAPVYDQIRGRVADGLDDGRVSGNSGAEANIVGAEALFDDVVRTASTLRDELLAEFPETD